MILFSKNFILKANSIKAFNEITYKEVIKFLLAGGLVNIISIVTFQLLLFFLNYRISSLLTYFTSFFLTIFLNNYYVHKNTTLPIKNVFYFTIVYTLNCIMCYYLIIFITDSLFINPRIGMFITAFCAAIFNFFMSRIILKSNKK